MAGAVAARVVAPDAQARWALLEDQRGATPAERVTALLGASVTDARDPRELPIGERDRLVLALRSQLSGDALDCVFPCACGETLELGLSVADLLDACAGDGQARDAHAAAPSGATVRVRAATGTDHELAARRAAVDPVAAASELVERCVIEARGPDGEPCALDAELRELAASLLAQLDPDAEIALRGVCPACGETVTAVLDPGGYVWSELEQWRARTELEVHVLASTYHWSEAEIVALDPARRARYIELLGAHAGAA